MLEQGFQGFGLLRFYDSFFGRVRIDWRLVRRGVRIRAIGPIVVPFWGSYLESYKVIPKRDYYGALGFGILGRLRPGKL